MGHQGACDEDDSTKQLITFMKQQAEQAKKDSEQKDTLINSLLSRIDDLTKQVASLSERLTTFQKEAADQDKEDENI